MTMNRRLAFPIALLCQALVACGSSSSGPGLATADGGGDTAAPGMDGAPVITPSGPGTVYGVVTDIGNGAPLAGAVVTGGGQSATTDARGTFTLAGLVAGNVNLSISNKNYAPGFASAKAGATTETVLVTLKKQGELQSYSVASAKTLSQKTEAGPYAVILAPNSLETTDTNLMVSITPLDPTKEREALPGNLVSGGATPSLLVPVTFAEFSILDSTGKRVNLKAGSSAQVELPIPPSLRSQYPAGAKIHCYSYDPSTGKWEDFVEGTVQTSTVDGTSPVLAASVRHFSWYGGAPQGNNCIDVYVTVVSAVDGKPLGNARVEANPGTVAYTDANGSALVRSTVGGMGSTYTAYQTGIDVDGSLTKMPGAKYIEFGKVQEELAGLVQKPCTEEAPTPSPATARGSQGMPLVLTIGRLTGVLYEATAILSSDEEGKPGQVTVILTQGAPGPDGKLIEPMAAGGAKITLTESGAAPVMLTELAAGTGYYTVPAGVKITPGKSYLLSIDGDGNGSIDGTGSVYALGKLAWSNPVNGATVSGAGLIASWTDTGSALGGAAYAPLYYAILQKMSSDGVPDGAIYTGTDRQFAAKSLYAPQGDATLKPGMYTGSLVGFSGAFAAAATGGTTNNITGAGVTGVFYSFSSQQDDMITFTVQ
jgi:hypothetical protein